MNNNYLLFFLFICIQGFGQYYTKHYIAPAPWQYWNQANEIVIGTLESTNVTVRLEKSDGTFITTLNVSENNPVSYRFVGTVGATPRNSTDVVESDKGLIITASHPIMVNLRNIASDVVGSSTVNIKGNASLVSFGNEGLGLDFRVGYYRSSVTGLYSSAPVYSVMAIEDNTIVSLPTRNITLNLGQSYLFHAAIGALIKADKPVVMNTGSWGDTPQTCGMNGEDGTFDQIAPIHSLGTKYLVVRGKGTAATAAQAQLEYGSEQTTIVITEPNTTLTVQHFNPNGSVFGTPITRTYNTAGSIYSFYHGNGNDQFSTSLVNSDKPIIVYSGTAVDCETDISTVLPIGGCAGALNIQTTKFINYNNADLPYFGFCIIEHPTVPVLVNGQDVELQTGSRRVPIGGTGFYLITFDNTEIGNPNKLIITSTMPLTSSLVQQGLGFSMSAFFSSFGAAAESPVVSTTNDDCSVTIEAESGYSQYVWHLNGVILKTTTTNSLVVTESGNYSVQVQRDCGLSGKSSPLSVEVFPCVDLSIKKETIKQNNLDVTFEIIVTNLNPYFTEEKAEVKDLLPNGFTYVSSTYTIGNYNVNSGIWTIGSLAPGQTEKLQINCQINSKGDYINYASIYGSLEDKVQSNNSDNATIQALTADLDAEKDDGQVFYRHGELLNYVIKVRNNGPQKALKVVVEDKMPGNTTEMKWSGNNKYGEGDLYDTIDILEVNEEITYNVTLRVPEDHFGAFINTVTVESDYVIDPRPLCTKCSDTDIPEFNIPKGISPNGDGENDYLNLEGCFVSRIIIYNRYGKEVYSKNNYINDWYGQDNGGNLLPSGTYFYSVYVLDKIYKTGYIEVVREVK